MVGRHRSFDWYLNSALASITALLFIVALLLNVLALRYGDRFLLESNWGQESPRLVGLALLLVVGSVFWFWIRMLNDYFRNRPTKHSVAWGWALFVLNLWAALAYFWFVWRPRHEQSHRAAA